MDEAASGRHCPAMAIPTPGSAPPARSFRETCAFRFDEAEALGFPVFLTASGRSGYYSILYSNDKHREAELGVRVVRVLFLIDCRA